MRSRGRRGRTAATALGTMIAIVAASGWTASRQGAGAGAPAGSGPKIAPQAVVHQVTLLTGDKVMVRTVSGGKPTVQVVRGPGRARVAYATRAYGSHLFVEPACSM